jgi:polyvinyl alcohol dehydrogenase (cytochrome)
MRIVKPRPCAILPRAAVVLGVLLAAAPALARATRVGRWDWPTYGHDAQHTFHGRTTLRPAQVRKLAQAWFFPAGKAVTAVPTVVAGTVYVGSWDGFFYAIDLATGRLRWKFRLDLQPAVSPQPDGPPDSGSDGGIVTSSAWFEPGRRGRPDLVLFAGGYTLYALDAATGALFWKHAYTGRPEQPPDPEHDGARIFSSPVVVDDLVLFGLSVDGDRGRRGYIAAADLATGELRWRFETDVDASGQILNDGCGSVWSSGTLLPRAGLVVFDVADCHFSNPPPYSEVVLALRVADGTPAWVFHPPRRDDGCDFDFGATVNAGITRGGRATFLGVGAKDGTYYALDPASGALRWRTNVVFGGLAGGFIATTAFDGRRVYGSTALGDFGRFEGQGNPVCDPNDPRDTQRQEPTVHTFDARSGAVRWQAEGWPSFAPTTVAGGMTFNCPALTAKLNVRLARTGAMLTQIDLPMFCWSGVATVGDALVLGTGASFTTSGGVLVLTPGGKRPRVPRR